MNKKKKGKGEKEREREREKRRERERERERERGRSKSQRERKTARPPNTPFLTRLSCSLALSRRLHRLASCYATFSRHCARENRKAYAMWLILIKYQIPTSKRSPLLPVRRIIMSHQLKIKFMKYNDDWMKTQQSLYYVSEQLTGSPTLIANSFRRKQKYHRC